MATTPAQKPLTVASAESIEERFRRLEAEWDRDTAVLSNPHKIMAHPSMREIISMGTDVVPIILRELATGGDSLLVWALPEITGAKLAPARIEDGCLKWNISEQVKAWLQWGREKGLVCARTFNRSFVGAGM